MLGNDFQHNIMTIASWKKYNYFPTKKFFIIQFKIFEFGTYMVCIISEEENKISKTEIYFTTPRVKRRRKENWKREPEQLWERETEKAYHEQNFNQYKDKEIKGHLDLELQRDLM